MRTTLDDGSELRNSYPSLSLPAQPVTGDSEATRSSSRTQKPTRFFGDPLRHSVKLEEDHLGQLKDQGSVTPVVSSPCKQLIRDRPHITVPDVPSHSFADIKKTIY